MSNKIARGGLLSRRNLLKIGGTGSLAGFLSPTQAAENRMNVPGKGLSEYGDQSKFSQLKREQLSTHPFGPSAGASSSPLQALNGTITPNSLHFERHHSGVPDIDPSMHSLVISGEVNKTLRFSYENLLRYPMETHVYFLECSGNSYRNTLPSALDQSAGELNGLVSCAEWTGIPLHYLLAEAGVDKKAKWVIAEGADAAGLTRSIPMSIMLDNAMIALYQNGEPLRPAQGYPMRLFIPGCEGNISVKWLKHLKVQKTPAYTREETSKYTDLLKNGKADMFSLRMEAKSIITSPSGKMKLNQKGVYEISGLAWSGTGAIKKVEVSADAGRSWAKAEFQSRPHPLALTRFRIPWQWDGSTAILQSRSTDTNGNVQPTREAALAPYSDYGFYHYNGIQSWSVDNNGVVRNVYV
ncbi:MAG: sulfane dehydrogenase subunit SoxC [Candidatus Azotimanducaceae bacterium]|jgi:sulfane dehydrogenase subunit SoxC